MPKILIVDDEAGVRITLKRFLEICGYEVQSASSGLEALRIVHALGPSLALVVLDLTSPGATGEELFAAVRKLQPDLPVCILSGSYAPAAVFRMMNAPRCLCLNKPCAYGTILQRLQDLLAQHPRK